MDSDIYESFGRFKTICKKHNIIFTTGLKCHKCFSSEDKVELENKKRKNNSSISNGKEDLSKKSDVSATLTLPSCSTDRQKRVLELYQDGYGYKKISRLLKISKESTKELIIRAIRNCDNKKNLRRVPLTFAKSDVLTLRLHNDEFSIKVLGDYNSINLPIVNKGRNLESKSIVSDSHLFIKLHKNNTLTFRFKDDIVGLSEDEVFDKANMRLVDFLDSFSYSGIVLVSKERVLSRHYGLLGSDLARKVREDRTQIIIREKDGKIRLRIDFSNETPEIDAESVKTGKIDINVTREYLQSILDKPHYKPDEVKSILDVIVKVQSEYAFAINNHNQAVIDISNKEKESTEAIKELRDAIKSFMESVKR